MGEDDTWASRGAVGLETRRMMASLEQQLFDADADPVKVGRFEIIDRLGEGAMGVVYRARDPGLDRDVAVKLIRHGPLATANAASGATERLRREARALASLAHPNVIAVLDIGYDGDRPFVAMELVEGGTLHDWCERNPAGAPDRARRLIQLLRQAALGLAAAHRAGVVHRDLKPHNLLVGADDRLRLADFGLARPPAPTPDREQESLATDGLVASAGRTEGIAGTPAYMAPEQFEGRSDERSDQFSLCASFWEAAFGARPFRGEDITELIEAIRELPPAVPADAPPVPATLRRVLLRGLSKDPADRFPTLDALLGALQRRRRAGMAALAVAGVTTAVVAIGLAEGDADAPRCERPPRDLVEAWASPAKAAARARFSATEAGAAVVDRVDAKLESYAAAWTTGWTEACTATRDGAQSQLEHDLRMQCLVRAQRVYGAVVAQLEGTELRDAELPRVAQALERLPDLALCSDLERLAGAAPMPTDPAARAEIERLDAELATQKLLEYAKGIARGIEELEALRERVEATGYAPLRVQTNLLLSEYLVTNRDARAVTLDEAALALAEEAALDELAVEAAVHLWETSRSLGGPSAASRLHLRNALALAERVADPDARAHRRAQVAEAEAMQLRADGKPEEALVKMREHLDYYEARFGHDDLNVAGAREGVAHILLDLGRYAEAEADLLSALASRRLHPDAQDDSFARIATAFMRAAAEQGRSADATRYATMAADLTLKSTGPQHPAYIGMLGNVGMAQRLEGDRDGARETMRVVLERVREHIDPSANEQVLARVNLAEMLDPGDERARLYQDAYDIAVAHHGAQSYEYALVVAARGRYALRHGEAQAAAADLREALAIFEAHGRARKIATAVMDLASALSRLGEYVEAEALARRAVADVDAMFGGEGESVARACLAHAVALRGLQRDAEAKGAFERASALATAAADAELVDEIAQARTAFDG